MGHETLLTHLLKRWRIFKQKNYNKMNFREKFWRSQQNLPMNTALGTFHAIYFGLNIRLS